jgi:hypothetical protein
VAGRLVFREGGGRAFAVLLWGLPVLPWWAMVVRWIEGGSAWWVVTSPLVLVPGMWLGWRLWTRCLVVTDREVVVRNTFSRVVVPREDVVAVEIVPDPWSGWVVGFRTRGRPGLLRSGVLGPRVVTIRSHEVFRRRVDDIAGALGLPATKGPFVRAARSRVWWPEIVFLLTISVVVFTSESSLSTRLGLGTLPLAIALNRVLSGFIRR